MVVSKKRKIMVVHAPGVCKSWHVYRETGTYCFYLQKILWILSFFSHKPTRQRNFPIIVGPCYAERSRSIRIGCCAADGTELTGIVHLSWIPRIRGHPQGWLASILLIPSILMVNMKKARKPDAWQHTNHPVSYWRKKILIWNPKCWDCIFTLNLL